MRILDRLATSDAPVVMELIATSDVPAPSGGTTMGPRLVFDTYDDIRGRCDTAPVRQTGSEPGYDHGAIVPRDDWVPLTADEAERHQADGSAPDSIRIELVRRPLPPFDPDDLPEHCPARPGRPMPMTPTQYAQTVPHHTVYACLYIRDAHDRPIQLRSVYGSRPWQLPGGNLDAPGEDPLNTARREAVEETGLHLAQDTPPRLIVTHFLHAGPTQPLNKVGLVFDGGRLSAEQLARIRLDPDEHDMWAVHDLTTWQKLMAPRPFARLHAIEQARRGEGPAYLSTTPAVPSR